MPHPLLYLSKIGRWGLSTNIEPETHLFSKATLLVGDMIAQNFLILQFFAELGHTVPSVNRHLIDFRPMNLRPALIGSGVPGKKWGPHGHTIAGRGKKPWHHFDQVFDQSSLGQMGAICYISKLTNWR